MTKAEVFATVVSEANEIALHVYNIHPFIDGNTRTTFSLRNYLLQVEGYDRLTVLEDADRYAAAWWRGNPGDHDALDEVVALELLAQDGRRLELNRRYSFLDEG